MSSILRLRDGTEFSVYRGNFEKAVYFGFKTLDLEKLLKLKDSDQVNFCGEEMTYLDAVKKIGEVVAYIPSEAHWLRFSNYF